MSIMPNVPGIGKSGMGVGVFEGCPNVSAVIFKNISQPELQQMDNYLSMGVDTSKLKTWNAASEEWVSAQGYLTSYQVPSEYKTYSSTLVSLSNDGYATSNNLTAFYLKTQTSSSAQISNALTAKADVIALNALSVSLSDYCKTDETSSCIELCTTFNIMQNSITDVSNSLSDYYMKSQTSSSSEISDALSVQRDWVLDQNYISGVPSTYALKTDVNIGYHSSIRQIVLSAGDHTTSVDCNDFIKDGMLSNAYLDGTVLWLTFNTAASADSISVELSTFVDDYDSRINQITSNVSALSDAVSSISSDISSLSDAIDERALTSDIPLSTSQLMNDSGYALTSDIPLSTSELINDSGYIVLSDIPTDLSAFENSPGYLICADVSAKMEEITHKIYINDTLSGIQGYSDLSIIKLSAYEYDQLVALSQTISNGLYIVEDEFEDAYGQQIKNVAPGTELSDAVNLEQLNNAISSIQIPVDLSAFTNSPGYLVSDDISGYYKNTETSSSSEISIALSSKADLSSVEHVVQYEQDYNGDYTAATIGSRDPNADIGPNSFVNGHNSLATGNFSHAEGYETYAVAYAHAEGGHTSALADTSHAECYYSIAGNQGAHAEGGYTSAFGYASHAEGGWTSTGEYAMDAHAEGGFTRADGPISHVEGVKATAELSDYQSFVWQGTDVMPNQLTDITPSTWDEYKAHGPGTFNVNPAKGLNGVYIGETSLYDLVKDDHLTIIEFDNGEARAFDWSGDISQATMIDAGLYDENEDSWILNPVCVKIGNGVTSIGNYAFQYCHSLTSVVIPDSVTSVGIDAFDSCISLTSVTIPDSVTSIGNYAFNSCHGLTNVTIPNSVTSIGDQAFYDCSSLTGIVIGKNVAVVGNNAFEYCTSLSNDSSLSSITIDKGNWEKLFNDVDFEYYRSNEISDGESTSMSVSVEASESFSVTIKLKTSSEEGYDILTLTLDGQELTSMSGETGWQYLPTTIPSGSHTAVLTYSKDESTSSGDDHAYFAIVQGCIAVKGKTQEEAEQLLADASVPETCKIITINDGSSGGSENQVNVTYDELVDLRDNNQLVPGMKYRITDYVTMVDQDDCQSAEHPFDLIVTAVDDHTLDEKATATLPSNGDDYFDARPFHIQAYQAYIEYKRVLLESWDIKYCLDNDKTRFQWADETNGKGVIWHMKDEFGNEAPYDFKNVQFKRYKIVSCDVESLIGMYGLDTGSASISVDENDYEWCYTFNGIDYVDKGLTACYDFSGLHISPTDAVISQFPGAHVRRLNCCAGNVMKERIDDDNSSSLLLNTIRLPNNVFQCKLNVTVDGVPSPLDQILQIGYCIANKLGLNCYSNTFGSYCYSNAFGNNCGSNAFGNNCGSNAFGNNCDTNTFGDYCNYNAFGNSCDNNTFGDSCYSNTFGDYCNNNTFGDDCNYNVFGSGCDTNTFGDDCDNNTFGDSCDTNTFGDDCDNNTFGDSCDTNAFGNNCNTNAFGNSCNNNTFGDDCNYNVFGSSCGSNTFGDSCDSNVFAVTCYSNRFGSYCMYNTLGNDSDCNILGIACNYNTFSNGCKYIIFGHGKYKIADYSDSQTWNVGDIAINEDNNCLSCISAFTGPGYEIDDDHFVQLDLDEYTNSYYRNIIVDNGNNGIVLDCTGTIQYNQPYKNVKLLPGINHISADSYFKEIADANVNQDFTTIYQPANSQVIAV